MVNVNYPGPSVGGNTETHCRIANVVMGALAPALKARSAATDGASHSNFVFGGTDAKTGEFFCAYDITPVGWGGRSFADGNDAVCGINGNCPHIPVEVFEFRYPLEVEEFRLVQDSGGPGTFRGGLTLTKTVRCTDTELNVSYMSDRQKINPWGLHGGLGGAKAGLLYQRGGGAEWLTISQAFNKVSPSKFSNVRVRPGDRLRISSPAGGGWGPPRERSRERVAEDVREGFVSPAQARDVYGFVGD
jgi:N-methylhydantoinase B/oxoprolinase/acetone carboxylase alpha subunit